MNENMSQSKVNNLCYLIEHGYSLEGDNREILCQVNDLLACGASPNEPCVHGYCAMHCLGACEPAGQLAQMLIKAGGDPNICMLGSAPLMKAAARGSFDACKVLIDAGADASFVDESGATALHAAALGFGGGELGLLLLGAGAPLEARTRVNLKHPMSSRFENKTALQWAGINFNRPMIDFLTTFDPKLISKLLAKRIDRGVVISNTSRSSQDLKGLT